MDELQHYVVRGVAATACAFVFYKMASKNPNNVFDIVFDTYTEAQNSKNKKGLISEIDYRFDIGLKLSPQNILNNVTFDVNNDLELLKQLYQREYSELLKRNSIKTLFCNQFKNGYIDKNSFKILSFNMLADGLSGAYWPRGMEDSKAFLGIDKRCLEWRYRGLRIIEEIVRSQADIICLQECDRVKFFDSYLSKLGFKYVFQEKLESPITQRVGPNMNKARERARKLGYIKSQNLKNSTNINENDFDYKDNENDIELENDGCAIFYNSNKFNIINDDDTHKLQIIDRNMNDSELTAIALPMKQLSNNKEFLVITTHLKSAKTLQGELHRKKQIELLFNDNNEDNKCFIQNQGNLPVLLCLDMNANHKNNGSYESRCYAAMTKDYNFISLCKEANTTEDEFKNNVKRGERGTEPEYTTYKSRSTGTVKHTIDYIFERFPKSNENGDNTQNNDKNSDNNGVWSVTEFWEIPETDEVIPNWFYPSDHFSLCLQLTWNDV